MKKFLIIVIIIAAFVGGYYGVKYIMSMSDDSTTEPPSTETVAPAEKEFSLGYGFSITLDDSFSRQSTGNVKQYGISNSTIAFIATRDSFEELEAAGYNNISEMDYAQLCINNTGKNLFLRQDTTNNWYYFEYSAVVDGKSYKYYSMVVKGESAYWLCQFAAYEESYDDNVENFKSWLKTIEINDAEYV